VGVPALRHVRDLITLRVLYDRRVHEEASECVQEPLSLPGMRVRTSVVQRKLRDQNVTFNNIINFELHSLWMEEHKEGTWRRTELVAGIRARWLGAIFR
jgi:hypothetical protein